MKYGADNNAIANLSLATSEQWKDKSGAKQSAPNGTGFPSSASWPRSSASTCAKDRRSIVEGVYRRASGRTRTAGRYTTEIVADRMQMLGGRAANGNDPAPSEPNPKPPGRRASSIRWKTQFRSKGRYEPHSKTRFRSVFSARPFVTMVFVCADNASRNAARADQPKRRGRSKATTPGRVEPTHA